VILLTPRAAVYDPSYPMRQSNLLSCKTIADLYQLIKLFLLFPKNTNSPIIPLKTTLKTAVYQVAGSNDLRKPSTGLRILSIAPENKHTSKTTIQIFVHLPDTVGLIPGMIQGQILLPSKGGTGRRLITASIALIKKILIQTNLIVQ